MVRKVILAIGVVCLLGTTAFASQDAAGSGRVWFGLGGSTLGLICPDLAEVNAGLIDRGFGAFGDALLLTGGRGRGGVLDGLSIGGIGWAAEAATSAAGRYADLALGFGGVEVGRVLGGDERSLLTLGVVVGGGGTSLMLLEDLVSTAEGRGSLEPSGVVPEPSILGRFSAFAAVEPFVSLQVQPLHYLGFELHLGYLVPIGSLEWGDAELAGVSPRLTGPVVGVSATWGAIGRPSIGPIVERPALEETVEQSVPLAGPCVEIDNAIGRIEIGVADGPEVRIVAVKRAHTQRVLDRVAVLIEPTRCGLAVHSGGPRSGYWEIEYSVLVPAGADVAVEQAAGDVVVRDASGATSIELGIGTVEVENAVGPSLTVRSGAGDVRAVDVATGTIGVELGTGDVEVVLADDASYALAARVGIGEISVGSFTGFAGIDAGGLGSRVEAVLGAGAGELSVRLGIGEIAIRSSSD